MLLQTLTGGQMPRTPHHTARSRQVRGRAKAALGRNFDVRRQGRLPNGPARLERGPSAELRRLAAETGLRSLSAEAGEEVRAAWNSFGLPKAMVAERAALSAPSNKQPEEIARGFLRAHRDLFALGEENLANLRLVRQTESDGATHLTFHQTVNGIPVFRGLVQITLDSDGRVVRAGAGELLLETGIETNQRLTPEQAITAALGRFGAKASLPLVRLPSTKEDRRRFRNPVKQHYTPVTAELAVFPLSAESARLAYRIYLELGRGRWYELFIDAGNGSLLFSQNLYHSSGRARVWKESPLKGPREMVDLPNAWLPAGATVTTGNNVDAYLDLWGFDEPTPEDSSELKGGRAFSSSQLFDFRAGEGSTGQDPAGSKAAAVTNLFYFTNLAHDYFYSLGFNEVAGNFQTDNFARGGKDKDAVRAEAQDPWVSSELGNFATPPDGDPPRMEIGIDAGPLDAATDDRDGAYSGQLAFHEYAHGVADRLVGGPLEVTCLFSGEHSAALAEGYSDYFAVSYFNDPVMEAYLARDQVHGLRRHTYDTYPYTYEDLGNAGFEPHNDGEIWAATLWDLRKTLGQALTDRLIVDSLRSVPCKPTMIDARDAILTADKTAEAGANRRTIWEIFARHGFGHSSGGVDGYPGGDNIVFDAAYDLPPDLTTGNHNPVMRTQPAEYASLGAPYMYLVQATDPDGDPLTYELAEAPQGMTIDPKTGRLEWTATFTARRVKVKVTDGKGGMVIHGFFIPVITQLLPGRAVTIDAPSESMGVATAEVPADKQVLQVTMRGGTGDADLSLLDPSMELYGLSVNESATETLSAPAPAQGVWWILVDSFEAYQNVILKTAFPAPQVLTPGKTQAGLSGDETSETFFKIAVPETASRLRVTTNGGSGDVDLLVRHGEVGTCTSFFPCDYDDASMEIGNGESIVVQDVLAGDWFVTLLGYKAYADVSLAASVVGPDFAADAVTNGASFEKVLTPGAIFTIFGKKLAAAEADAGSTPLPVILVNTSLTVNGTPAPLYYVSPTQINAQLPFEAKPGEATVVVKAGDLTSEQVKVAVGPSAPGIFQYGTNRAVVQNQDGVLNDSTHPAVAGTVIVAYLTGISPLDNAVPTGAVAPLSPLSRCTAAYSAAIGGKPAEVLYLGLTPYFVGLAQANIKVSPLDSGDYPLQAGDYPLQITVGGVASNGPLITVAAN